MLGHRLKSINKVVLTSRFTGLVPLAGELCVAGGCAAPLDLLNEHYGSDIDSSDSTKRPAIDLKFD